MDWSFFVYDATVWIGVAVGIVVFLVLFFVFGMLAAATGAGFIVGLGAVVLAAALGGEASEQIKETAIANHPQVKQNRDCSRSKPSLYHTTDEQHECFPSLKRIKERLDKYADEVQAVCLQLGNSAQACEQRREHVFREAERFVGNYEWFNLYEVFGARPFNSTLQDARTGKTVYVFPQNWSCQEAKPNGLMEDVIKGFSRIRARCVYAVEHNFRKELWPLEYAKCLAQWEEDVNNLSCDNLEAGINKVNSIIGQK